ncbi:astacin [Ancylostoma ceylanicum]|uniref:Metalloendopeptidase n=1 Tax=Ancylostoma ceylanicum TaxID=53326 RepID=A0A0D6LN37_9BILA|nr:astacin [Ancylostoma ceylanicum]
MSGKNASSFDRKIRYPLALGRMRAFLLVLFCVGSGFSSVFQEKVKNALAKVNITLDIEQLRKTHDRIEGVRPKIEEMLKLSPQEKISLADLVEHTIKVRKNHVRPKGDSIEEINHKSKLGGLLYQGDIVLTKTQAEDIVEDTKANTNNRPKRQAFLDRRLPQTRWDKGVDYYFHSNATEDVKRVFLKAMNIWMKDTCIDFRENDKAEDRLCVTRSAGLCFSSVGRVGTAAHEIGHTLGFFHTHSRHDRDKFILFNRENVESKYLDEFTKQTTLTNENYGIPYDYGSIMHYGATMASLDGQPTMLARDGNYTQTLGSPFVSFYDLIMMNFHYGCNRYGGKECKERPQGCGQEYEATSSYKVLEDVVGHPEQGYTDREDYEKCTYWVKAPTGKKIEIEIVGLSDGLAVDGCQYGGVEIKTNKDQKLTGYSSVRSICLDYEE